MTFQVVVVSAINLAVLTLYSYIKKTNDKSVVFH